MFNIGNRVGVKDSSIIGKVVQIGDKGLIRINISSEHSPFDRTVYNSSELHKI